MPPLPSRCHAVLARVPPGCSPPQGRLSTRYSPVRRSTAGLPPRLARLACVKHAASVHSEPGSNSPVELVGTLASTQLVSLIHLINRQRLMLIRLRTPIATHPAFCSFEVRPCEPRRNHVCLCCYPIQLSKNRLPSKGRPDCQTLPSVSSEMFPRA